MAPQGMSPERKGGVGLMTEGLPKAKPDEAE